MAFVTYFFKPLLVLACDNGTYGYNCVNNCSGHCLNDSPCNKQTGHCDWGCKPGYTNSKCSKGNLTNQCVYILEKFNISLRHHQHSVNTYIQR